MTYNPNWSEEQGKVNMGIERDDFMHFEEPECLKRFPSNENFDEDEALLHSFGLKTNEWIDEEEDWDIENNLEKLDFTTTNLFPESEQLGIAIDSRLQDDLERLDASISQNLGQYWQNTDEITVWVQNSGPFSEKQALTVKENECVGKEAIPSLKGCIEEGQEIEPEGEEDLKGSSKEVRWRKEDDKNLFSTYRAIWRHSMMNLRDVISTPLRKNKIHKKLILEVAKKAKWKGKISMLVRRLQKILNNNNLSVREKQDLTRMYKKQVKEGNINWESMLHEFPGKTLIYVQEFWKDIKVKIHPDFPAIKSEDFKFKIAFYESSTRRAFKRVKEKDEEEKEERDVIP